MAELKPAQPSTLTQKLMEVLFGDQSISDYNIRRIKEAEDFAKQQEGFKAAGGGLGAPIPGANPEVPTPGDAIVGALMSMGGAGIPTGISRAGETPTIKSPGGRIRPDSKYHGPLSDRVKGKLYRETGISGLVEDMMGPVSRVFAPQTELFTATNKNLARGQGRNTGVMVEIDPRGLSGRVSKGKPASQFMLDSAGQGEILLQHNTPKQIQDSVRSFVLDPKIQATKLERVRANRLMKTLESEGWTRTTTPDGKIKLTRPK